MPMAALTRAKLKSMTAIPVVRLEGFEPPTYGSVGHCSIQLSYRRFGPVLFSRPPENGEVKSELS